MDYDRNARLAESARHQATTGMAVPKDPECESASRIRDGLCASEERLSEVHSVIDGLERRLETVLSPIPPMPAATPRGNEANVIGSHVTGRVQLLNEGFAHAVARIRELTRRVEV